MTANVLAIILGIKNLRTDKTLNLSLAPHVGPSTHLSCVPIRKAKQLHRDFHLNAWILFSVYLPPVFMPRTNIAFVGSTRYLNSLNLIWKLMLLVNTQLCFTITAVAVAILM